MSEKNIVSDAEIISYEGYFSVADIYNLINRWTAERSWDKYDKLHEVKIKEDGRHIDLYLEPNKGISDYAKFIIEIKASFSKVTDVEVEVDGKKMHLQHGSAKISLTGVIVSDYEGDWESSPKFQFLRTIYDKFVYREHTKDMAQMLKDEVKRLKNEITAHLNMNRHIISK
jgi:hypothetical protein